MTAIPTEISTNESSMIHVYDKAFSRNEAELS